VVVADLDFERLADVRAKVPSLASRQAHAYRWPTEVDVAGPPAEVHA
jgi:hypothetical protein